MHLLLSFLRRQESMPNEFLKDERLNANFPPTKVIYILDNKFWIPACAGMTRNGAFQSYLADSFHLSRLNENI